MAGEEDIELRDLVAHTLETRGVLGNIRAQLRASVFLALEEQESQQKPHPLVSSRFQQYLKTKDGQVVTALVREFLNFFDLDYTCSVFDPETNAAEVCPERNQLVKDLGLDASSGTGPLLNCILQRSRSTTASQPLFSTTSPLTSTHRQPPHSQGTGTQSRVTVSGSMPGTGVSSGHSVSTHADGHSSSKPAHDKSMFKSVHSKPVHHGRHAGHKQDDEQDDEYEGEEQFNGEKAKEDELDDFYDRNEAPFRSKPNNKFDETEDFTLSENSLTADFDYAEPAKF